MTGDDSPGAGRPWADIPRELAEHMRPHLDAVADDIVAEIQFRVPEYDRPPDAPYSATLRLAVERVSHYFVDRIADPGHDPESVTDFFHAIGRAEVGEGRSLDALQTAIRVGGLIAWRRLATGAVMISADAATIGAVGEALLVYQDELAAAAVAGYAQAKAAVAGEMQRRRQRLLDLLLTVPPAGQEMIADLAGAAHWPVPRTVAAVALGGEYAGSRHPALPPDILADLTRHTPTLIVPDPDGPGRAKLIDRALGDGLAAVGPTVSLGEASRSMEWARKTLALAERGVIEPAGVIRSVEHMSTLILFQDEDLLAELARVRLAPLAHLRSSQQDRLAETLLAWLQSGRNANEVAMRLHVHPQTVRYRLRQLEELFGDRLLDPDQRFDLEIVLRARYLQSGRNEGIIPEPKEAVGQHVAGTSAPRPPGQVVSLRH